MAASSNESFGLKIATAFSIALTVVLLVAVYFLNSNYNQEFEKNAAAQKKIGELNTRPARRHHPGQRISRQDRLPGHRGLRDRQDGR